MKVLRAKKHAKMKKNQPELQENQRSSCELEAGKSESDKNKVGVIILNQSHVDFIFVLFFLKIYYYPPRNRTSHRKEKGTTTTMPLSLITWLKPTI